RDFIALLGGAAAWPLAAGAQQPERMGRIGVLMNFASNDPEGQVRYAAFLQGLQQWGWSVGQNVRVDARWGAGDAEQYRQHAAELIGLRPDVVVAAAATAVGAVHNVTRAVPIVFVAIIDPVGTGVVESLARPGGNATGFSLLDFGPSVKWLELLQEIAPTVKRVAVIRDPAVTAGGGQLGAIQAIAPS